MGKEEVANVFRAFSDERRLEIIGFLTEGEECACNILAKLSIGQSTLSHHMKVLCDSGIIMKRKEGKWTYYQINEDGCLRAGILLKEITKKKE